MDFEMVKKMARRMVKQKEERMEMLKDLQKDSRLVKQKHLVIDWVMMKEMQMDSRSEMH